jgi:predicted AAA+ superfamily ATPase
MFRFIIKELQEWLGDEARKPLIIRGARQTGKTWVVRELAKIENKQLIELNFERNPEYADFFKTNHVDQILLQMEATLGASINCLNSIIFLDEIQAVPELLAKLRWFSEERPELAVIAAGSLLEFALEKFEFSMPVGRISYMYLEPLSFEEFVLAKGNEKALEFLQSYQIGAEVSGALHQHLMQLIKEYILIGGLPAAVVNWCKQQSLDKVNRVHFDLLTTYRDDFAKYAKQLDTQYLDDVLNSIPKMLGEKFVFSKIREGVTTRKMQKAFELLKRARLAHAVVATHGNGLPLKAEANEKYAKAILLDVGITGALLGLSLAQLNDSDDITLVNKGGVAEQLVGQQLRCLNPFYIPPELHYWLRTQSSGNAEIDYLIQHKHLVIPIEVKAGKTGTLKSLHAFMAKKKLNLAVRFNADTPSKVNVDTKLTTGESVQYQLLSLPFYLVGQLNRLLE